MARYSIGRLSTNVTISQAAADVAGAASKLRLVECGWFAAAATACIAGLNRTLTLGTRTTPAALISEDTGETLAPGWDSAIAHSVQPTFNANDFRVFGIDAVAGKGVIWTFPNGLAMDANLSLALVNRATNTGGLFHHFVVDDRRTLLSNTT